MVFIQCHGRIAVIVKRTAAVTPLGEFDDAGYGILPGLLDHFRGYSSGSLYRFLAVDMVEERRRLAADVDQVGAGARGEAFVMARFETHTVGNQVLVLPKGLMYTAPQITGNYIDELIGAKLNKIRILPSDVCSDEEFLRRVRAGYGPA